MFISEEQAQERLNSESNLANRFNRSGAASGVVLTIEEREQVRPGKKKEDLSEEVRTEIATRSRLGENQELLAREFQTSQANISHIKTGRTSGIDEAAVSESLNIVRDRALDRLMASMNLLTDDKLSGCSAKDLSVIASNMGRVVDKTIQKSDSPDKINLIIYAPELKRESSYKVIEVG